MNLKKHRIFALLLFLLPGLTLLPPTAFAAQTPAEAVLPVSVRIGGDLPDAAETYRFRLTPIDNAPLPENGQGYFDVTCTGGGSVSFPAIRFQTAGVYHYTLSQVAGSRPEARYDDRVYEVSVSVTNSEDARSLTAAAAIRNDGRKTDTAEFVNTYTREVTYRPVYVRKLWADNGLNRPETVSVQLISEGRVLDTAVLNAGNGWSYAWKDIIEEGKSWSVQEYPVPRRYIASYSYENNMASITNTYTAGLIQTGQLTWPIWVLGGAGVLFAVLGLWKRRKSKNE